MHASMILLITQHFDMLSEKKKATLLRVCTILRRVWYSKTEDPAFATKTANHFSSSLH